VDTREKRHEVEEKRKRRRKEKRDPSAGKGKHLKLRGGERGETGGRTEGGCYQPRIGNRKRPLSSRSPVRDRKGGGKKYQKNGSTRQERKSFGFPSLSTSEKNVSPQPGGRERRPFTEGGKKDATPERVIRLQGTLIMKLPQLPRAGREKHYQFRRRRQGKKRKGREEKMSARKRATCCSESNQT